MRKSLWIWFLVIIISTAYGCGQSTQERVRRSAIGTWLDPNDGTMAWVFSDGGAFNIRGDPHRTSGTWSVSETGGISAVSSMLGRTVALPAVMKDNNLIITLPTGNKLALVRDSSFSGARSSMDAGTIDKMIISEEAKDCRFFSHVVDAPGPGIIADKIAFLNWIMKDSEKYHFIGNLDNNSRRLYDQNLSSESVGRFSWGYFLFASDTIADLDRDTFSYVYIDLCSMEPKSVMRIAWEDITPGHFQIRYTIVYTSTPLRNDLLRSPFARLVPGLPQPNPAAVEHVGDFVYKNQAWTLSVLQ